MNKSEITAVIIKYIKQNVPDFDESALDTSRSLASYGANSLDIVEIVSGSMRELRIKVPRTELAKLKNIGDLVDLFAKVKEKDAK